MTPVTSFQSFRLEFQKARRKPTLSLILAIVGIITGYLFAGMSRTAVDSLNQPWESLFFYLPLMNTLFLSIFMAILASRVMDLEYKSNTWDLLQTLQTRKSIFFGKTLYGLFWAIVFAVLQLIAVSTAAKIFGFPGYPPLSAVLRNILSEILAGLVIYQIGCLFSLIFPSQFAALSVNLCGTLAGFFLMYVNDRIITPWSIMAALRILNMSYHEGDAAASYQWFNPPSSSWIIASAYFAVALCAGLSLYTRMEEGSVPYANHTIIRTSSTHTSTPAELIKLRRNPVWIVFLILPLISASIGTFNFTANQGTLSFTWGALWTQQSLFLGIFFLPPLIGIFCGLLWRMEHTGANWNLILSLESPWKIVKDKLLAVSGISVLCMLWVGSLYIICGKIVGLPDAVPFVFYECIFCGMLGCIAIAAVQLFISLIIRSFAIPIGIAIVCSIAGLLCVVKGWIYVLPNAMLQAGLKSTNMEWSMNLSSFAAAALCYIILFYLLCVFYLQQSDV